jgi:hypothetical protein
MLMIKACPDFFVELRDHVTAIRKGFEPQSVQVLLDERPLPIQDISARNSGHRGGTSIADHCFSTVAFPLMETSSGIDGGRQNP